MLTSGGMLPRKSAAVLSLLCILTFAAVASTQEPDYGPSEPSYQQAPPRLSPGELTNLVAPIALYPDPLLSQVLVVSTYPQELMAAAQWLQQYGYLQGRQLMAAAQQQNWDPSVQALVAFPSVMSMLTSNMQWTAELGQAFLAQPSDVMNAVQYLRGQARANGQLQASPEYSVNAQYENGQSAIEIQPADPQTMYVPAYDPASVWGPPAAGAYPDLSYAGSAFGSLFSAAVNLAGMFAGFPGLLGPSGWGWALGWLAHTLFVNNSFFSNFGFGNGGGYGAGYGGSMAWVHNNRRGSPYAYGAGGAGWRGFNGGRTFSRPQPASAFAPARPAGGASFGGRYPAANGGDWQRFSREPRAPVYQAANRPMQPPQSGNRQFPPDNRFMNSSRYPTRSTSYRPPAVDRHSAAPGYGGFSNFNGAATRSAPRAFDQSGRSWTHPLRSSQPKMDSGRSFWSGRSSGSMRAPKPPRMPKAPHYKAPHFKSHGSGHVSHGHSGGKHRW
jgi:hypothetical protein